MAWLKPCEVSVTGTYVMARTDDDDPNNVCIVHLCFFKEDLGDEDNHFTINDINGWDEECRFLGPLEMPR